MFGGDVGWLRPPWGCGVYCVLLLFFLLFKFLSDDDSCLDFHLVGNGVEGVMGSGGVFQVKLR